MTWMRFGRGLCERAVITETLHGGGPRQSGESVGVGWGAWVRGYGRVRTGWWVGESRRRVIMGIVMGVWELGDGNGECGRSGGYICHS